MSIASDILSSDAKRTQSVRDRSYVGSIKLTPKMQQIIEKSKGPASPERRAEIDIANKRIESTHLQIIRDAEAKSKELAEKTAKLKAEKSGQ
jgi:hypothetical protein